MKNTIIISIFLPILLLCDKSLYSTNSNLHKMSSKIYVDSLIADFNHNGKDDKILIERNKKQLTFLIYSDGSKIPIINSKKILFKVGDLGGIGTDFIILSFENNVITVSQEFGSMRPDGWYGAYISSFENTYTLDSISIATKKWGEDRVLMERRSKIIKKPLKKVNVIKEFEKF